MSFESILFTTSEEGKRCEKGSEPPLLFVDLFLDQIIAAVTAGKKDYDLKPFFYTPLRDIATIRYRQEIARDHETPTLSAAPSSKNASRCFSCALILTKFAYFRMDTN